MKQKLGLFGAVLPAAVFIVLMILPLAVHASAAETATVVYLSAAGTDDGDGLTPETAVNSINTAYSLLDPTKDCTVVICGEFTQKSNFARPSSAKSITLTSVYDGVDYRTENGAVYKASGVRFGLADDTTFENITFETTGGAFLLVAQHHAVTIGEGVEMRNFDGSTLGKAFWVVGGFQWNFGGCAGPKYMNTDKATNVTVLSGNDMIVVGGAREFSVANGVGSANACTYGDVNVHIGGEAEVSALYAGAYASAYTTVGNVNVEIFGNATVGKINGVEKHNTTASNFTLLWIGGDVGAFSLKGDTNTGVALKIASGGAVTLEATEDVQKADNYKTIAANANFTTVSTHTHNYGDWVVTKSAEVGVEGEETRICEGCSNAEIKSIPALQAQLLPVSTTAVAYADGLATVRFIVKLKIASGVEVENYGIRISPDENEANARPAVMYNTDVFENGEVKFAVDLVGIPEKKRDTVIYAWAFVKLAGEDPISLKLASVTVNDILNKHPALLAVFRNDGSMIY